MRINFEMFVVFLRLGMTAVFSKKKERGGSLDNRSADARQWHQRSDGIASAVYSTFIFFFCVIIRGVCLCACDFSDTHIFFFGRVPSLLREFIVCSLFYSTIVSDVCDPGCCFIFTPSERLTPRGEAGGNETNE